MRSLSRSGFSVFTANGGEDHRPQLREMLPLVGFGRQKPGTPFRLAQSLPLRAMDRQRKRLLRDMAQPFLFLSAGSSLFDDWRGGAGACLSSSACVEARNVLRCAVESIDIRIRLRGNQGHLPWKKKGVPSSGCPPPLVTWVLL